MLSKPPAVAGQVVVVVEMRVLGVVVTVRDVIDGRGVALGRNGAQGRHGHRPQPPAIAGSSRTSSAGATGVSSPAR